MTGLRDKVWGIGKWALGSLVVLALVAYVIRLVGLRLFESDLDALAASGIATSLSELSPPPVSAQENAAIPLSELIQLVDSGAAQFEPDILYSPDPVEAGDVVAAVRALGDAHDWEDVGYDDALELSVEEMLEQSRPSEEAQVLVASWLPELRDELLLIDRVCERRMWRFENDGHARDAVEEERLHRIIVLMDILPWLSVSAVHEMRNGRPRAALERLRQSFHLARAAADDPSCVSFPAFVSSMWFALKAMERTLEALPPGNDLNWLSEELQELDTMELMRRNARHSRTCYLDDYRQQRLSPSEFEPSGLMLVSVGPRFTTAQRRLYGVIRGFDAHTFAGLSVETLAALDRPHAEALRAVRDLERAAQEGPWYAPTAPLVAGYLTNDIDDCVDLESQIRLARIALVDYQEGRGAALEALESSADPSNEEHIRHREEADGSLTLWCTGHSGVDRDGRPLDENDPAPMERDIVWTLAARDR